MNSESPCLKKCELNKKKTYCVSCLRTVFEITNWNNFSLIKKRKIIRSINLRKV